MNQMMALICDNAIFKNLKNKMNFQLMMICLTILSDDAILEYKRKIGVEKSSHKLEVE